jgi:hypothetical protein
MGDKYEWCCSCVLVVVAAVFFWSDLKRACLACGNTSYTFGVFYDPSMVTSGSNARNVPYTTDSLEA